MARRKSYGNRLLNSFFGVLLGIAFFLGSFALLGWNEYDAVRQTGAITELDRVALADVRAESVEAANEGKLVHIAAEAVAEDELEFREFGVREKAIHLRWETSIYQWEESTREEDDHTHYEYDKEWVDQPIDSSHFHDSGYSNEGSTKHFHDGSEQAKHVNFGAFQLTDALIRQIDNEQRHPLPPEIISDVRPAGRVVDGVFYTGDPSHPEIGDEKVEVFIVLPQQPVTVMAQQSGNTFSAYQTKVGIPKSLLYLGKLTKEQVIGKQRTEAAVRRWLFRALGFIFMWIGLALILGPIKALVSFIPLASRLLEGAIGLVTFFIAAGLSFLTIAMAWFAVRPLMSIVLFAIAGAALYFAFRTKSDTPATNAGPPPLPS